MIRLTGLHKDGRKVITLGLSAENIRRLTHGEPIMFDAADQGFDGYLAIIYGKTEDKMLADLKKTGHDFEVKDRRAERAESGRFYDDPATDR